MYNRIGLTFELFIEFWYVIVKLRLIHVTSNWIAELVLCSKVLDRELAAVFAAAISQALFIKSELVVLFVQQKYVSVQACTLRRSRTDVLGEDLTLGDVGSRDVAYQPMMPLAELGILSAWSVGICLNMGTHKRDVSMTQSTM